MSAIGSRPIPCRMTDISTLCILVDFHKHIDTISMGKSILCFKGQVIISKLGCIMSLNIQPDKELLLV